MFHRSSLFHPASVYMLGLCLVVMIGLPVASQEIKLMGSVGAGGTNNKEDVKKVQARFVQLGFSWVKQDGQSGPELERMIKMFQSIKNGKQAVESSGSDGRIDVGGDTHKWLQAQNAPMWTKLTASGPGFVNVEISDTKDDHDFGTNWLDDALIQVAASYEKNHRKGSLASLMTINDASKDGGVDTPDHQGHETGMCVDLRLPQTNNSQAAAGGRTYKSSDYDQEAARALIKALRNHPQGKQTNVFFNDPDLVKEGLCKTLSKHDDHIHIEIAPPVMKP